MDAAVAAVGAAGGAAVAAAAAAGGAAAAAGGAGEVELRIQYDLPVAFRVGAPASVSNNEILAGLYGAMVEQVLEIRARPAHAAAANRSFQRETKGKVKELQVMHIKAMDRADMITRNGDNPYPMPIPLTNAAMELYELYDIPLPPGLAVVQV